MTKNEIGYFCFLVFLDGPCPNPLTPTSSPSLLAGNTSFLNAHAIGSLLAEPRHRCPLTPRQPLLFTVHDRHQIQGHQPPSAPAPHVGAGLPRATNLSTTSAGSANTGSIP
jgi:hypothetical protein